MKSLNRLTTAALTVALAAGALAACDSDSSGDSPTMDATAAGGMPGYAAGVQFKSDKPLDFSMLYSDQPLYPYKADWLLLTKLKDLTNVSLDMTLIPMSDYEQKRSLLVSAGDAPLIIPKTYPGQELPFVSSGAILPVSDYINLMPNFQKKVADWKMDADLDTLRQADGKFYVLPGLHQELWPDYTVVMRTDILEKNGIAVPKTWDEFEAALEKLKAAYPDKYPMSDRFMGKALLQYAGPGFGTNQVGAWGYSDGLTFNAQTNKLEFAASTDQYKQLVTYFNELVTKGLLDPESFTQDEDTATQKFVNGDSFAISGNSQNVVTYRNSMNETLGQGNFTEAKILLPAGPAGPYIAGSRLENGIMISAKAKDDPNFVAMMQFIDWLYYSDAGQEFAKWGVEGTTYTKDASGKRALEADVNYNGLNPAGTKDLRVDFGFSGGVFAYGGTTDLLQSMMSDEELTFQKEMASTMKPVAIVPPHPLTDVEREQATLTNSALNDYTQQTTLQFILGQRPLSQWNDFVSELKGKGMDQYVDTAQKAYERAKSNS